MMVITNAFVTVDAVDLSTKANKIALHTSAAAVDQTTMGDGWKKQAGGIQEWSLAGEFEADEVTMGTLFSKLGQKVAIEVRASSAVAGPSNPSYKGDAILTEFSVIDAAAGDDHRVSLTLVGSGALDRAVA